MALRSVADLDFKGKRVLVRVDFNVPIDAEGRVDDDTRIRAALPTIRHLCDAGARVILTSHLGRPKGTPDPKFTLRPTAERLSDLLERPVAFAASCVGAEAESAVETLTNGDVLLLENVRFHKAETANDPAFATQLAGLAECYVNDAFGSVHRAHASTEGVARLLPNAAGFLLLKEIEYLEAHLKAPAKPFVMILGGAKVSDKIGVITNLMQTVDAIVIGGGMAYTFLKAQGVPVGDSKLQPDKVELAGQLLKEAADAGVDMLLPEDHVISDRFGEDGTIQTVGREIPDGFMALDIGPKTSDKFCQCIRAAKTIVWNGPMGVFEMERFFAGTRAVGEAVAQVNGLTIAGGGDTVSSLAKLGLTEKLSHVSTGGGASLEMLEGKALPGIVALQDD